MGSPLVTNLLVVHLFQSSLVSVFQRVTAHINCVDPISQV